MTPAKLLIAQRLDDVARELSGAAATASWWANEVRAER